MLLQTLRRTKVPATGRWYPPVPARRTGQIFLVRLISTSLQTLAATRTPAPKPTPISDWASLEARTAAEGLLRRWHAFDNTTTSQPASDLIQTLDANQLHLLRVLVEPMVPLPIPSSSEPESEDRGAKEVRAQQPPREGEQLLPAEHLVYFTPRIPNSDLALDGSDPSFNPPGGVFTRRMWAGGQMDFLKPDKLTVGSEVRERTFVEDALVKKFKSGAEGEMDEMLVVWLRKEYEVGGELILCDRRSWVFRKALLNTNGDLPTSPSALKPPPPKVLLQQEDEAIRPTSTEVHLQHPPAALFRFSALTYNAHQIHLDSNWARTVEGHQDVVVHGPLNLLLLCRFWLALEAAQSGERRMSKVTYRAKSPLCAYERYKLVRVPAGEGIDGRGLDVVQAVRADSDKVIMEAIIESIA